MKPQTKQWLLIGLFLFFIALLSLIDLGLNIIGLIPGAGDLVETASETVVELIQVSTAAIGMITVALLKR